jgi:hypothetical protein
MEAVPRKTRGGTERAVGFLAEAYVQNGHHVTAFANAEGRANADLVVRRDTSLLTDERSTSATVERAVAPPRPCRAVSAMARPLSGITGCHRSRSRLCDLRRFRRPTGSPTTRTAFFADRLSRAPDAARRRVAHSAFLGRIVTGLDADEAAAARGAGLERRQIRLRFAARFSRDAMARGDLDPPFAAATGRAPYRAARGCRPAPGPARQSRPGGPDSARVDAAR